MSAKFTKRDQQIADDWQWLANTPQGQRSIADLMVFCDVYTTIEESDPVLLAMAVGANNIGKRIAFYLGFKGTPEDFSRRAFEDTDVLYRMESSRSH